MSLVDSVICDPARVQAVRELGVLDSSVREPLDRLTRLAASSVQAPVSAISLLDDERQHFVSIHGVPAAGAGLRHVPVERSVCQFTIAAGQPQRIADLREDPRVGHALAFGGAEAVAYLGVPLRLQTGGLVGSVCVLDAHPREWTEVETTVLNEVAAQAASFLALRSEVLERILHDPATGMPDDMLFLARCETRRRRPDPGTSAMLCLALDAPTRAGRRVGPRTEQAVRRAVARRLSSSARSTDQVGLLRENVFAVFAHELADERDALCLASRLHSMLGASPVIVDDERFAASAMIGIAFCDDPAERTVDLLGRAEQAMRAARHHHGPAHLAARAV